MKIVMDIPANDDILAQLDSIITASGQHITEIYLDQDSWAKVFPLTESDISKGYMSYLYKGVPVTGSRYKPKGEQALAQLGEIAECFVGALEESKKID